MSRFFAIAVVSLSLSSAAAQTPADLARQVWPSGPPVSTNVAPAPQFRNEFLPSEIAGHPVLSAADSLTRPPVQLSDALTGIDLSRLRGDATPSSFSKQTPAFRTVVLSANGK